MSSVFLIVPHELFYSLAANLKSRNNRSHSLPACRYHDASSDMKHKHLISECLLEIDVDNVYCIGRGLEGNGRIPLPVYRTGSILIINLKNQYIKKKQQQQWTNKWYCIIGD